MSKKVKGKIKTIDVIKPKVIKILTGSIYNFSYRSNEKISNPVIMTNTVKPKVYKKGRSQK